MYEDSNLKTDCQISEDWKSRLSCNHYIKFFYFNQNVAILTKRIPSSGMKGMRKLSIFLKKPMSTPPVLGLSDFSKPFIIECDASGEGIGAILMQIGQPLAYLSQGIKGKSLNLSTYKKELLALVMAIRKWRHYLLGHNFKVRTNQQALKYLLEQRIGTPTQQKWVSKLLGFYFTVEYKKGRENRAANALS